MANNKLGQQTFIFQTRPEILGTGSVVGVKRRAVDKTFDVVLEDDMFGKRPGRWRKANAVGQ